MNFDWPSTPLDVPAPCYYIRRMFPTYFFEKSNLQESYGEYTVYILAPRKNSAMYLGTLLTDSFDNRAEVMNRLGDCVATCRRMKLFWNKANTSVKWKIQVFNAIVRSKLLYGLEAIQLTQTEISKLNAFQNRSLRRILKIPPTFIDRS